MKRAWLPVLVLSGVMAGCAVGKQLTAPKSDYQAYRRTRTASSMPKKLEASWSYLRERPAGRWHGEVRAWFREHEPRYWARAGEHLERLREYLATLPDGPHAEEARERVERLELRLALERRSEQKIGERGREIEERLETAATLRRALLKAFGGWVRRLASIDSWGERTSALDHQLLFAWRIDPPGARCRGRRCARMVVLPYAIPDEGKVTERQAVFDVVIELDADGGVDRALVTGPDLFNRIGEAAQLVPTKPSDAQARAESIGHAVQIVEAALAAVMPATPCSREAVSPHVLVRECNGVRLEMIAGAEPGQEDRIVVFPVAPAKPPKQPEPAVEAD